MSVNQNMFCLVGNFGFNAKPKGLSVFRYEPDTAHLTPIATVFDEVNVGHITLDAERRLIYITDEISSRRGQVGGGGYVLSLRIDPESGALNLLNEKPTLCAKPCYTWLDKTRRYLLVSHHADSSFVTKVIKGAAGFSSAPAFDDAALTLFRLHAGGSLAEISDLALMPGGGAAGAHPISHLHSVTADPSGELFIVLDKGLDAIHTFHLDREHGSLVKLQATPVEHGMAPRYAVFHPQLPIFYANFEGRAVIQAYHYDAPTGRLDLLSSAPLLGGPSTPDPTVKIQASDIVLHPNGRQVYVSIRGLNLIAVLDIDNAGAISFRDNIACGGLNPRGLHISPDGRFLLCANVESGNLATFKIETDGRLLMVNTDTRARCPGVVKIITV